MRHKLVDHVRVRDDGREAQLRSDVRGTRGSREDIVIINEWVPLGLASQGFDQANQCITEGTEAFNDRRDELAAHTLCKRVVLVLFDLLLGRSGDAGGGHTASGTGRWAAGVGNGDVEEEMMYPEGIALNLFPDSSGLPQYESDSSDTANSYPM